MTDRQPALGELLRSLEAAFLAQQPDAQRRGAAHAAFRSLDEGRPASVIAPARLDACCHLDTALANAREQGSAAVRAAADAFAELAPQLAWARRPGSEREGADFHDGHANAILIGPRGLEAREDCWLGVSLLAPGVQYPLHRHPPEELYVVLSEGDWFREGDGWFAPGIGGTVHNPSGCVHSMRADTRPLLAFWLLWGGNAVALA